MIFAGVDIGSTTTEAVLINEDNLIVSKAQTLTGIMLEAAAKRVLEEATKEAGIAEEISYCIATGYGRNLVKVADEEYTEIACHAKGASYWFPEARGVIDIGGQDSKAIRLNEFGGVDNFAMNDKCAAGTGRFLDVMANIMGMSASEMGEQSLKADKIVPVSSICTVFAESEVISLLSKEGVTPYQIMAGINHSVVHRVNILVQKVSLSPPIVMTGGVANNVGVVKAFEDILNTKLLIPEDPQSIGALGAALIARKKYLKKMKESSK